MYSRTLRRSPGSRNMPLELSTYKENKSKLMHSTARPLFQMIGKISALANRRKDRVDEISEVWFRQSAARINDELRAWRPELQPESTPTMSSNLRGQKDLLNAALAIQWASILRLHQVVEGYNRFDSCVAECTSKILDYVSKIRFGSPAENILIFPLVMAASGCVNDEDRIEIRQRWVVMERTIGFDNIYRAREMVEAVWKAIDGGSHNKSHDGGHVNWARIRFEQFPGVVLL